MILPLIALICLGFGAGGVLTWVAQKFGPSAERDQRFLRFVIGTLTFQCAGLAFIHAFIRWHKLTWRDFLGLKNRPLRWIIIWAVAMSVFAIPATLLLNSLTAWVISHFKEEVTQQTVMVVLQESGTVAQRFALGFAAIVIAPVFEEGLFRGILYPVVKNAGYPTLALAGTSLLFGAIHGSILTFLPLTFLGLMFAVLYEKTDSLLAPILSHALFNAVNFTYIVLTAGRPTLSG